MTPSGPKRRVGGISTLTLLLCIGLALAPLARASYDPLGKGKTRLVLDKSFLNFLKRDGVKLSVGSPGRLKAGVVTLPVSDGLLDPVTGKGTIEQEGALVFSGRKRVPLRDLVVKTKHPVLSAKVGGSQLKIATSSRLASRRKGFASEFSAQQLKLTDKVVRRLNKKLRPPVPFEAGQPIGSLVSKAEPLTTKILETTRATFVFAPALLSKLDALHVSLNPISPAELAPGPLFTLPIGPESAISTDARSGMLRTAGAIELLQLHAGQIFWRALSLDLAGGAVSAEVEIEPAPPYPGKLGRVSILDLDMGSASISSNHKARTITADGARLSFQAATAAAFNQAFAEGKETFKAGEEVGAISFVAQAQ